jgi:excinuclease ABC subunit B
MEKAIQETERRRQKQQIHNEIHHITPVGISKTITDILEVGSKSGKKRPRASADPAIIFEGASWTPKMIVDKIQVLEKTMRAHAQNLEFEEAGQIRDMIRALQTNFFKT